MAILTHFYDIESLSNVFTVCNYKPDQNKADVYYLVDEDSRFLLDFDDLHGAVERRVHESNPNFDDSIDLYDLSTEQGMYHLARTFGLSDAYLVNDPTCASSYDPSFRPVCDTDPDYSEVLHPYLLGYNSYNYDTTMLALFFYESFNASMETLPDTSTREVVKFKPTTAKLMRRHNDLLFQYCKDSMPTYLALDDPRRRNRTDYKRATWKIRKSMLMSGRHIDVARLNEKQQHVGLKRLLGMLGLQILESEKTKPNDNTLTDKEQFLDLIAYNMSDVVNLETLFNHKIYMGNFKLKRGLLRTYPELIYDKLPNEYAPDVRPGSVRRDRLTIDSSSAQFATKSLCPYGHLKDIPVVSFMYPSEKIAKERGIPRRNILDETGQFIYDNYPQKHVRDEFDRIYAYYKSIEGRNFNSSRNYADDYGNPNAFIDGEDWVDGARAPESIYDLPKTNTCMFYYNADGTPSSCFVTFSIGGIHGAEYNKVLWEYDKKQYDDACALQDAVKAMYPNPVDLKKAKSVTIDGTEYKAGKFLTSKSTMKNAEYKDLSKKCPQLFKVDAKGKTKLNEKYTYTSADQTNHEDFTSYYPNLLIAMSAFYNDGLGYDRYNEIFGNKQKYGKLMKDKSIPEDERAEYAVQREGTKLVLNSASGAGDANYESNIRMNNNIISMRVIGQLFSFRIGAAQTLRGAKITSTNTDGLYSVLEEKRNNEILAAESANISVEIEPEPVYLISKDSNNRTEVDAETGQIKSASGGSLSCRKEPLPTKSLNHPAIIDWALTEYLIVCAWNYKDLSLSKPFDRDIGLNILKSARNSFKDDMSFLRMFQNVLASSSGTMTYIFGTTDKNPDEPVILQNYNRVFIMKDGTPDTMHLHSANARVITAAVKKKRANLGELERQHDLKAVRVLKANGVSLEDLPENKEALVQKVTGIHASWSMFVQNKNLAFLSDEERSFILDNLDYEKYLSLLAHSFEKNWRNHMPGDVFEEPDDDDDEEEEE